MSGKPQLYDFLLFISSKNHKNTPQQSISVLTKAPEEGSVVHPNALQVALLVRLLVSIHLYSTWMRPDVSDH